MLRFILALEEDKQVGMCALVERETSLTREIINGLAVDVGLRMLLLFVVMTDSLALTMLVVESNDMVCRLEFECRNIALPAVRTGSLSTLRNRSGMSIAFAFSDTDGVAARCESSDDVSTMLIVCRTCSSRLDSAAAPSPASRFAFEPLSELTSNLWMRSFSPDVFLTNEVPLAGSGAAGVVVSLRGAPFGAGGLAPGFFSSTRRPRGLG